MASDTLPFRYADYHSSDKTPKKVDYIRMAHVVASMELVRADLAGLD